MGFLSGLKVMSNEQRRLLWKQPRRRWAPVSPPPFYFSDAERENSPPTKSPAPIGHFSTFSPTVNFSFARQLLQKCEELYIQSGPVTMEQANKPQD